MAGLKRKPIWLSSHITYIKVATREFWQNATSMTAQQQKIVGKNGNHKLWRVCTITTGEINEPAQSTGQKDDSNKVRGPSGLTTI